MTVDSEPGAIVEALRVANQSVATAESLTGGLVCAALVGVPGASDVVRGGVVAYQIDVKIGLLGVDSTLLDREGAVHPQVAEQLAQGARERLGATWGLGTTGVAGPGAADGHEAGTVFIAVAGPDGVRTRRVDLSGGREAVRFGAVRAVLADLHDRLGMNGGLTDVESDREGGGDDSDA